MRQGIYKAMTRDDKNFAILWHNDEDMTYIVSAHRMARVGLNIEPLEGVKPMDTKGIQTANKFLDVSDYHTATIDRDKLKGITKRRSKKNGLVKITSDDKAVTVYAQADYIRDFSELFINCTVGLTGQHNPILFKGENGCGLVLPVRVKNENTSNAVITDITLNEVANDSIEQEDDREEFLTSQETDELQADAIERRDLVSTLRGLSGIRVEIVGSWVWVDGDTKPHKEELKGLGLRWSRKRQKWYKGDTSKYHGKYRSPYKDFGAMQNAYA